jgi:putative endonuclease
MDKSSKEIGKLGEKIAERYLRKKGYKILDRNYSFFIPGEPKRGEVDIVAKKGDLISFFEVKFLKNPKNIFPEEKINFKKRKRLIKIAESWLIKNKIPLNSKWQIDIIAIVLIGDMAKISHFENAIS